eukprot:366497-Chlamydomonas_euryale.AAC.12
MKHLWPTSAVSKPAEVCLRCHTSTPSGGSSSSHTSFPNNAHTGRGDGSGFTPDPIAAVYRLKTVRSCSRRRDRVMWSSEAWR